MALPLVYFDEDGKEFVPVREFSPVGGKFAEANAWLAPIPVPGLDGEQFLIWGSGETYRGSSLYLGAASPSNIAEENSMRYFAGTDNRGQPIWAASENDAEPVVKSNQIGEFSVIWNEELEIWLLAYNSLTPRAIKLHWATNPWGPWSNPIDIFEPWNDGGYTHFMHALTAPDSKLAGPVINVRPPAIEQWGGEYAPYMVERFSRFKDDTLTIYYLMSTWNPYTVVLMRTDLRVELEQK